MTAAMIGVLAQAQEVSFPPSAFIPIAVGFLGLGTGYLIYGPQELFKLPGRDRAVDLATGIWGIWMPGFLQFLTGVILFVGLAWLQSFRAPPLYMTALAFTAYGVHWWALGMSRAFGGDPRPNAFMSIPFTIISVLGVVVFFLAHDARVAGLFIGLTCVYVSEFFASLYVSPALVEAPRPDRSVPEPVASRRRRDLGATAERALEFFHLAVGLWLMYLTWAAVLNIASGYHLPCRRAARQGGHVDRPPKRSPIESAWPGWYVVWMRFRGGCAVAALVVVSLLGSGCTSRSAPTPVSLPVPAAGEVTFYLSLPSSTSGLGEAVANVATPGSSDYRHFSSLDKAASQFGATDAQINTVAKSIKTLGLRFAADPTRLFGRVTGSTQQWQAALGTPLSKQAATAASPFITYTLPQQTPAALQPSGTSLLLPQTLVYDPTAEGSRPPSGNRPTPSPGGASTASPSKAARPFPVNTGTPLVANCSAPRCCGSAASTPPSRCRPPTASTRCEPTPPARR